MTCYTSQSVGKHNAMHQTTLTGVRGRGLRCGVACVHCFIEDLLSSGWCVSKKSGSNETNSRTSTFLGNERMCPSDVVPH